MPSTVPRPDHRVHGGGAASGLSPGTAAPASDWIDRLAAARPEEFAELFHEALTDDFGAVSRLHQMLETASEWCRTHGARGSASELDALTGRLTDLGEELHLVGESLGHEIRSRSHRAAAAARVSPVVSVSGPSVGQQNQAAAPIPPSAVRSLPRSR
ncbi:hypothetical protein EES39_09155 [Streptomyces sp. ADI92-24]|uniref:hypothetical protein n=1 Tax=Streptomyces sp. ADI92-24 TaxID=1522756 RepID=UPI000F54DE06|nr:hypothetical protein [Streptomyces sp. ADI92-24]RPK48681.1 hypothetical protein EES39_09155 [Streptomyces sp. ADI92-24]